MKKYVALTSFLKSLKLPGKQGQWIENIELQVKGTYDGTKVLLHTMQYRAVFSIEDYAYRRHSIELLEAQLVTWLGDNDDRSELDDPMPNIDVDVLDDDTADVEITLQFEEDVYIVEAEDGPIVFKGKRWQLENPEHDIAESGNVTDQ